jgi:hypothetical protein
MPVADSKFADSLLQVYGENIFTITMFVYAPQVRVLQ